MSDLEQGRHFPTFLGCGNHIERGVRAAWQRLTIAGQMPFGRNQTTRTRTT
ncbi:unnamed protein product, partial [marine sediment metagenome]